MRAAIVHGYGQAPELGGFPDPVPDQGQSVVEVLVAALNPVDISIASGRFYEDSPPPPYVAGREGVGRTPGGELAYFGGPVPPYGACAERSLVDSDSLIPAPGGHRPGARDVLRCGGSRRVAVARVARPPARWGDRVPREVRRAAYERMVVDAAAGRLIADFERVPLDRVAEAWERQRRSPGRKLVIVP